MADATKLMSAKLTPRSASAIRGAEAVIAAHTPNPSAPRARHASVTRRSPQTSCTAYAGNPVAIARNIRRPLDTAWSRGAAVIRRAFDGGRRAFWRVAEVPHLGLVVARRRRGAPYGPSPASGPW